MGLSGHFSHEDIQDLLGVMGDTSHGHVSGNEDHHHQPLMLTSSDHLQQQAAAAAAAGTTTSIACTSIAYGKDGGDVSSSTEGVADNNVSNNNYVGNQPGEDAKAHARSERKRSREKQRRSDVNKQFNDLTQLLQKIDAEDAAAAAAEAAAAASNTGEELGSCDAKSSSAAAASRITFNPSNRVDLISRTILQLERLHEANKRRKSEIASLQQQLEVAKKAGEDTAAKLKEAMLAPPGQPMTKVCLSH